MLIRPFVPERDMEPMVAVMNQTYALPVTVEEMWHRERSAPSDIVRLRLVAEDELGRFMGFGSTVRTSYMPSGRFTARVMVDPAFRRRGVGGALYEEVLALARESGARELESMARELHPESLRFAESRGFRIRRHMFASTLDLHSFDERPFAGAVAGAEAAGFRFFSLAEIADSEENRRHYYDLDMETTHDIPGHELKPVPFDEWQNFLFAAQSYRADGQIIAALDDRWAGVASVTLYPESSLAYNSYTGVRQEFRGHRLAQALKVLAVRMALRHGMSTMRTNNDSENAPMLAINRKFGYVPEPGDYWLIRDSV